MVPVTGCRNASAGTQLPERDVEHSPRNLTVDGECSCIMPVPVWGVVVQSGGYVGFTFNNVTLLRAFIMNTAPIVCKLYMKYHLRIKNGKYGDAVNFCGYARHR